MAYKLGRNPRTFDPRVPHHAVLKAMLRANQVTLPPITNITNNAAHLPDDLGMMLNDRLGDCADAGILHLIQLVTGDAQGSVLTEPDETALRLYQEQGGYRGGLGDQYDPTTDHGTVLQELLQYVLNTGVLLHDNSRHRILSFVEVDVTNLLDVCEVIREFGCAYIGFNVPHGFMDDVGAGNNNWDVRYNYGAIEGGHCVILPGYTGAASGAPTFNVISWGQKNITMQPDFFQKYVDECYAVVDPWWIEKTGRTPYGLDLATLEAQASALRIS